MKDKRKHQRIKFLRKVVVVSPSGKQLVLDVLDYSMGGMSVLSKEEFWVGDVLKLKTLTTLDGEEKPLDLLGEIRHIEPHELQGFVVGIMFKEK